MTRRAAAPPPSLQADLRLASALSSLLEALTPHLAEAMVAALAIAGYAAGRPPPSPTGQPAGQPVGGPAAFTVEQAAKRAGLSRSSLFLRIKSGQLIRRKVGSRSVVLNADLDAFLAALPTKTKTTTNGATDAAPAAPTASPPVGQPRAARNDNNAAATGVHPAAKRDKPRRDEARRVGRQADQGGADGQRRGAALNVAKDARDGAEAARRSAAPPRRAQRAPAPRRTATKSGRSL
jgi:hypothetical protein